MPAATVPPLLSPFELLANCKGNVRECKNPNKTLVAATFEKAKPYVFAEARIRDREVGGSNPLATTNYIKRLRLPLLAAVFHLDNLSTKRMDTQASSRF